MIEADSNVFSLAQEFYGVPELKEKYFGDVGYWIWKLSEEKTRKYDVVIHDTFVMDTLTPALYTIEFWENVKRMLAEDGIIALVSCPPSTCRFLFGAIYRIFFLIRTGSMGEITVINLQTNICHAHDGVWLVPHFSFRDGSSVSG